MHPYSTMSPITQLLVQVHAIVEKIAGVNGPLVMVTNSSTGIHTFCHLGTVVKHFHQLEFSRNLVLINLTTNI